jgi:hypothetical protein
VVATFKRFTITRKKTYMTTPIEHAAQAQQDAPVMQPTSPSRIDALTSEGCGTPPAETVPIDYGVHAPYVAALSAVFNEDGTAFADCIDAHPHILEMLYQGWPLLHHIAQMGWTDGIEIYRRKNGRLDIKSEDFVTRFMHCMHLTLVGGQTLLHVAALYQRSSFASMADMFPQANTADYNQRLPAYYLTVRDISKDDQDLVIARVAQQSVISLELQQQHQHPATFDEEVQRTLASVCYCNSLVRTSWTASAALSSLLSFALLS